jgi:hypothetical protein
MASKSDQFIEKFQALCEEYDVKAVRCDTYNGDDEPVGEDSFLLIDDETFHLYELVSENRFFDR